MLIKVLLLLSLTSFIHGYNRCRDNYLELIEGDAIKGLRDCEKKCYEKEKCDKWSYNEYGTKKSCLFQKSVGKGCNQNEEICFLELMYGNNWKGTKNCGSGESLCRVQYKTEMTSNNRELAPPNVNSCGACAKRCSKFETCKYWNYVSNKCYIMESFSKSVKNYKGIGGNKLCGDVDSALFCKGQ